MQISDIIGRMGGLKQMAQELGISESQAASGAAALTPAVVGGFKKKAQSAQSDGGLDGLIDRFGGGDLLDNVKSPQPTDVNKGNNILGQIFGSKDVSRSVAQDASDKSGLDSSTLKKMLPMVAMMVTGYMAKQRTPAGAGQSTSGGGLGGMLNKLSSGGDEGDSGIGSLLGLGGDGGGNALDDIMKRLGRR